MRKVFLRGVALTLVVSLVMDPTFVHATFFSQAPLRPTVRYTDQALIAPISAAVFAFTFDRLATVTVQAQATSAKIAPSTDPVEAFHVGWEFLAQSVSATSALGWTVVTAISLITAGVLILDIGKMVPEKPSLKTILQGIGTGSLVFILGIVGWGSLLGVPRTTPARSQNSVAVSPAPKPTPIPTPALSAAVTPAPETRAATPSTPSSEVLPGFPPNSQLADDPVPEVDGGEPSPVSQPVLKPETVPVLVAPAVVEKPKTPAPIAEKAEPETMDMEKPNQLQGESRLVAIGPGRVLRGSSLNLDATEADFIYVTVQRTDKSNEKPAYMRMSFTSGRVSVNATSINGDRNYILDLRGKKTTQGRLWVETRRPNVRVIVNLYQRPRESGARLAQPSFSLWGLFFLFPFLTTLFSEPEIEPQSAQTNRRGFLRRLGEISIGLIVVGVAGEVLRNIKLPSSFLTSPEKLGPLEPPALNIVAFSSQPTLYLSAITPALPVEGNKGPFPAGVWEGSPAYMAFEIAPQDANRPLTGFQLRLFNTHGSLGDLQGLLINNIWSLKTDASSSDLYERAQIIPVGSNIYVLFPAEVLRKSALTRVELETGYATDRGEILNFQGDIPTRLYIRGYKENPPSSFQGAAHFPAENTRLFGTAA